MINYFVWKNELNESKIIVQVFNKCDVPNVQKEFIDKGYIITGLTHIENNICFIACKWEED